MAKRVRSLVKAISYRILGSGATMMAAFIFTGDIALSGAVGIGDFVIKAIVYYAHERVWANISWGRSYQHGKED